MVRKFENNKEHQQPSQEVKKLSNGSVQFPYSKESSTGAILNFDFIIQKEGEKTVIKNLTNITEKNKGYVKNKDTIYELDTTSTDAFLQSLKVALDGYVGSGRPSAADKGKEAYRLLGYGHVIEKEQSEEALRKETRGKLEELENAQRYKRNKTTQTLSYSYSADLSNIWKGGTNDLRNVDVTFQHFSDTNTTKVTLDVTTGLLFGKSAKIEKEFSDKEMDNISAYIRGQFEQGIKDKKEKIILQKRGEKLPNTVKKISEKAENAVKAYRYYLKQ